MYGGCTLESSKSLLFSVKVGKSYKNKGWALNRDSTIILIPKLSYEDECDIVVDGIHSKAKFNIVPRIFYNKNEDLKRHLKKLADDGIDRIDLELLLNHDDLNFDLETERLLVDINKLNHELQEKDSKISNLKNEIKYLKSFDNDEDEELINLHNEIEELKNETELLKEREEYQSFYFGLKNDVERKSVQKWTQAEKGVKFILYI